MNYESALSAFNQLDMYLSGFGLELSVVKKKKPRKYIPSPNGTNQIFKATRAKEYREKAGLTVWQLSKKLGVDQNIVKRMEDDTYSKRRVSVQRFADYFGVPFEEMLVADDQPDETE